MSKAIEDVLAERRRQIEEGYGVSRDISEYPNGELSLAAACYAMTGHIDSDKILNFWPWLRRFYKPKDLRRTKVIAAALLIADIDRMDAKAKEEKTL